MAEEKKHHRMVVEEVSGGEMAETPKDTEPVQSVSMSTENQEQLGEVKEKVEELQDITQDLDESVEKSQEVEKEIAQAVEEVSSSIPVASAKKEEEQMETDMPRVVPEIKSSRSISPLVIIVPGLFLLGALLGGIYFYQKGLGGTIGVAKPTPTPEAMETSATPSASPSATLDLTKYPVNVLNGSGIAGEAGKAKTSLEKAGFKVSGTGNASSYDFTKTVIKAKADVPEDFLTKLTDELGKTYSMDKNQTLAASSSDSVQVIIGSSKAK